MERRNLFPIFWIFFLVINGIKSQENVDNGNEIVEQPTVIDQNVTEQCPGSVHTFLQNTTRSLFLTEIMPEIEAKLAQKDEMISQLNSSINELKVRQTTLEQALLSGEGVEDQITLVLVKKGIIDCENNTQCDGDKACLDSYKEPGRMLCEPVCERYKK